MAISSSGDSKPLERHVIDFLKELRPIPVGRSSVVQDDLGIDGDDAVELIVEFSKRFKVDMSDFPYSRYFGPEGLPPTWLLYILKWCMLRMRNANYRATKPLYVKQLIAAARDGKWREVDEP